VRKGRAVGDFDFAELEELARTSTRPGTAAPGSAAPPPRPAAAAPPPAREPLAFTPPAPAPVPPLPPAAPTGASVFPLAPAMPPMPAIDAAATQRIPVFADEGGSGQTGERFGQYTLLERIAVGGMAEVWKARMRGVEGFQKTVAIKRILPHMTDNAEFVGMFIDEAKLAAQLTHPNIVHIYDLGKIGRDYYIAMEYVDGKDLLAVWNRCAQRRVPFPVDVAVYIVKELARGLGYAHAFGGLKLVHRDVSPANVLLSYTGEVKLTDFGLARSTLKLQQTAPGIIFGKLSYLAPEQARSEPLDGRTDLYAAGILLWELLTGQQLFPVKQAADDAGRSDSTADALSRVRDPQVVLPSHVTPRASPPS
jgi:serine/threonine protein kinase